MKIPFAFCVNTRTIRIVLKVEQFERKRVNESHSQCVKCRLFGLNFISPICQGLWNPPEHVDLHHFFFSWKLCYVYWFPLIPFLSLSPSFLSFFPTDSEIWPHLSFMAITSLNEIFNWILLQAHSIQTSVSPSLLKLVKCFFVCFGCS